MPSKRGQDRSAEDPTRPPATSQASIVNTNRRKKGPVVAAELSVLTESHVHNLAPDQDSRPKRRKVVKTCDPAPSHDPLVVTSTVAVAAEAEVSARPKRRKTVKTGNPVPSIDPSGVKPIVADTAEAGEAGTPASQDASAEILPAKAAKQTRKRQPKPIVVHWSPDMRPAAPAGPAVRMLSWNVAGIRAVLRKEPDVFQKLVSAEQADLICLQEIKISPQHIEEVAAATQLQGWHMNWNCSSDKAGYSGVAILSRTPPLSVQHGLGIEEHDGEGRAITAEFDGFFLVSVYAVNSGEGLRRLDYRLNGWDKSFAAHIYELEKRKPVVICGDLNCAHEEIDIHSPKTNLRSSGFTQEERDSFTQCYTEKGFVDTFRAQHPGVTAYTYWTYKFNCRANNKGWRIDYFLVSQSLSSSVHDSYMLPNVMGSDHCPIGLILTTPQGGVGPADTIADEATAQ